MMRSSGGPAVIGYALPCAYVAGAAIGIATGDALHIAIAVIVAYPYAHVFFRRRRRVNRHR